jgi:MerR family transcriptional regulator, copper efflux regulator
MLPPRGTPFLAASSLISLPKAPYRTPRLFGSSRALTVGQQVTTPRRPNPYVNVRVWNPRAYIEKPRCELPAVPSLDHRRLEVVPSAPKPERKLDDDELLRVGDLARISGKTVRAIHHYEELGLIEPVRRSKGHYRLFTPETRIRVQWIGKLQSLGLSLTEIRQAVTERGASPTARRAAAELRALYDEKLREVRQKLGELRELENELAASLAYLDHCTAVCVEGETPSACGSCTRHDESEQEPLLVAGARLL